MKNIVLSLGALVFLAAVVVGGTGAFFSDVETSVGNTFTAGSIDLSLGSISTSTANGGGGAFETSSDNAGAVLFNFTDLKPGDAGTVAFLMDVTANDAYVCSLSTIGDTPENGAISPEVKAGDDLLDGVTDGELQDYVQFATFDDDNENGVFDSGEPLNVNQYYGDGNGFTAAELAGAGWVPIADTTYPNTWLVEETLVAGDDYSAGFMYCFGNFDSQGDCSVPAGADYNMSQTDSFEGSIEFYSVQTRNNDGFVCTSLNPNPS